MPRKKSAAKIAKEKKEIELSKRIAELPTDSPLPVDIEELKRELREEEASEEESDAEEEDDYGELLTEDVENGLSEVLKAIKTGDQRLFDSNVQFFKDEDINAVSKKEDSKPIFLKEYHRKALLEGNDDDSQNFSSIDGEKTYVIQQKEDKENLIKEMHNAISDDEDDDDDDFLVKKEKSSDASEKKSGAIVLPDPEKEGGEKFLEAFMENHAWLPDKGEKVDVEQEDDAEFDDAAERFENAYNFRYEDPKSTEIISYARSQATMRREKMNSRKRDRLKSQEEKHKEKEEINEELKKKKQLKVNLVVDRIKEIKEAVGDEISDERILEVFGESLMNEDFSNEDWDAKMAKIFDDEYYGNDDENLVKPEWDDDMMGEEDDKVSDDSDEEVEAVEKEETSADAEETSSVPETEKSRKSKKKEEKYSKKQEKNKVKDVAERLVESKTLDILDEVSEERGKGKENKFKFKYREVEPETFGLTYNEIFSANDAALNDLIGLKKLAPYRPHEKINKDKRKITKSKNMREWRRKTFGSEAGISRETDLDIKIPSIVFDNNHQDGPKRKVRKTNKKKGRK